MAISRYLSIVLVGILTTQIYSTPCDHYICRHGGSCIITETTPKCHCLPEFYGDHCEFSSDPCYKFGCLNEGNCTTTHNVTHCVCPPGYSGLKCEALANSQCPLINSQSIDLCAGAQCSSDFNCTNDTICCPNACGSMVCTDPHTTQPNCTGGCPPGYKCELQPKPCVKGHYCPLVMVSTCVAPTDQCGGCPDGQFCKDTGIRCKSRKCPATYQCVTMDACGGCPRGQKCESVCAPPEPCDEASIETCQRKVCKLTFACVPDLPDEQPLDACGRKCTRGYICKETRIICTGAQCPAYECVPDVVYTPPESCNFTCGQSHVCQSKIPNCPRYSATRCGTSPIPQCVPKQNLLADCPVLEQTAQARFCSVDEYKRMCSNDSDCNRATQRCCPALCDRLECTNLPAVDSVAK